LKDESGLADARLASENGHRSGYKAPTKNPVQLVDARQLGSGAVWVDGTERLHHRAASGSVAIQTCRHST
jgi:hypothetical protein